MRILIDSKSIKFLNEITINISFNKNWHNSRALNFIYFKATQQIKITIKLIEKISTYKIIKPVFWRISKILLNPVIKVS
jgi:hypothetical protein